METTQEKFAVLVILFVFFLEPITVFHSKVKEKPQAVVVNKTKSNSTYGFFVRKNNNSGWGQDIPPF